jgi:hypothetical protein
MFPAGFSNRGDHPAAVDTRGEREGRLVFSFAGETDRTLSQHSELDWPRLLAIAMFENAAVPTHHFAVAGATPIPSALESYLACTALDVKQRMLRLEHRFRESLATLSEAGIPVTLLKGAAMATTVYRSFMERPMNDIDLLIEPHQASRARGLMLKSGWAPDPTLPNDESYASHHHLAPLIDASGTGHRLELHTALLPHRHPFNISDDALRLCSQPVCVGDSWARVLSAAHHAVYVTVHWAWSHECSTGAWHAFRDIGALVRHGLLDWDDFVSTARSWRAGSCAYWTLRLGRHLAALSVPNDVILRLKPPLPEAVLSRLERHFSRRLLHSTNSCPSVSVERALWSVAMCPRRSGHGRQRPWLVPTQTEGVATSDSQLQTKISSKARNALNGIAYLASIV